MQNSKFNPGNSLQYSKNDLNADFQGIKFDATVNTTTTNDFKMNHDYLIDGAVVFVKNGTLGDKINFQIIDIDNIMNLGANTVLGQFVTNWYVNPDDTFQTEFKSAYPAKIFYGLYLRISYVSVSETTSPTVMVNYKLHKVLW